jgi:hypothetical protein
MPFIGHRHGTTWIDPDLFPMWGRRRQGGVFRGLRKGPWTTGKVRPAPARGGRPEESAEWYAHPWTGQPQADALGKTAPAVGENPCGSCMGANFASQGVSRQTLVATGQRRSGVDNLLGTRSQELSQGRRCVGARPVRQNKFCRRSTWSVTGRLLGWVNTAQRTVPHRRRFLPSPYPCRRAEKSANPAQVATRSGPR